MVSKSSQKRVDIGIKKIGEFVTDAYVLRLEFRHNELACYAAIEVVDQDNSIPPAELINVLRHHGITTAVDLEQVAIFCSEAATGASLENFLLASGIAPVHGEDGWFELIVATGHTGGALVEDEFGRVDFKNIQNFSNIATGQQIGRIYPPTPGKSGVTATGKPIPPKPGKPSPVRAGSGVRFSEDGTQLIAEQAGRALFDKNVLSVVDEMVIAGDVDFNTGHITFNGFVEVKGDVLDDFNISAAKGINVIGTVGACRIQSGGPVTLGSMAGKGSGRVSCQGTFRTRYLNQTVIECWGDVHIEHEIRNSSVKATGRILSPKGVVSGGECIALEGIEVKTLGTQAGPKTQVTSGIYFPETDRLKFLRGRIKTVIEQVKKIGENLNNLNKRLLDELQPALREALELRSGILTQRQANLATEREALTEELLNFQVGEHKTANPRINILGSLKERVIIDLGETSQESAMEISGPISIIEIPGSGGLRHLTYSPLRETPPEMAEEGPEPVS